VKLRNAEDFRATAQWSVVGPAYSSIRAGYYNKRVLLRQRTGTNRHRGIAPRLGVRGVVPVQCEPGTQPRRYPLRSVEVEAIEIHDLVPRGNEVVHELPLGVVTAVYLR